MLTVEQIDEHDILMLWGEFAVHGGPQGPFMLYQGFRDAVRSLATPAALSAQRAELVRRLLQYAQFCARGERDLLREAANALSQPSAPKPAPLSPERVPIGYLSSATVAWLLREQESPGSNYATGSISATKSEKYANAIYLATDSEAPSGWQPIETAPSDVPMLLYCPDRGMANPERIEARVFHSTRGGSMHAWATHWMPLPAPPLSAAEAAKPK